MKNQIQINDVTPFSEGLETNGAKMAIVIGPNFQLPAKATQTFGASANLMSHS